MLGRVGREAVRAHPGAYAKGVARSFFDLLDQPLFAGRVAATETPAATGGAAAPVAPETVVVNGVTLPRPTEGEPIPSEHASAQASTPDGSIREVWTSATEHHLVFDDPRREAELVANGRQMDELLSPLPRPQLEPVGRPPDGPLVEALPAASGCCSSSGLSAIVLRRPWGARISGVLAAGVSRRVCS